MMFVLIIVCATGHCPEPTVWQDGPACEAARAWVVDTIPGATGRCFPRWTAK